MKKWIVLGISLIAMLIIMTAFALPVSADTGTYGDLTYLIENDEVKITDCDKSASEVVIPNEIDGYPVTAIGDLAFAWSDQLVSIELPPTITQISSSFYECYSLKNVYISDLAAWCKISFQGNPLETGADLYLNGSLITDLVIPESVTEISSNAFYGCDQLKSVTFHDRIASIGGSAFYLCESIESVYINDLANWCEVDLDFNSSPLEYAEKLYVDGELVTTVLKIPREVTRIKDHTFWGFSGFRELQILNNVNEIGLMAFTYCSNLESVLVSGSNETYSSRDGVLFNKDETILVLYPPAKADESYTVPASVSAIGDGSIRRCNNLKKVIMGDNVVTIGMTTFSECDSLESVSLGRGIQSIDRYAFNLCDALKKVELADLDAWFEVSFGDYSSPFNSGAELYVAGQLVKTLSVPEHIKTIPSYAFLGCSSIERVILHNGITGVGAVAFQKCSNIKDVWCVGSVEDFAHLSTNLIKNAVWHYDACPIGADHTYDNTCDTSCNVCGHTRTITHSYKTEWSKDGSKHWHECSVCGVKKDEASHTYTNACDTSCNVCGHTRTITHSYSTKWSTNSSNHWHECSVCGAKKDEAAHKPGAAATETTAQTCTVCGYVIKAALGHTHQYDTDWSKDETAHWHECDCGAKKDTASHNWDDGKVTTEPTTSAEGERTFACTVCGATRVEKIDKLPAVTTTTPVTTEPAPETTPETGGEVTNAPTTDAPVTDAPVTSTAPTTTEKTPTTAPDTNASVDISADNDGNDNGTLMIVIVVLAICLVGAIVVLIVVATRKKSNS